ncbi:MAG: efflux RND transporter periplasmic adaptor subunit [Burkholderiaceae bacterium]|nr:efflux RND transporter periplasmic adaptor subunit [Burkholderiaceae bacterium]
MKPGAWFVAVGVVLAAAAAAVAWREWPLEVDVAPVARGPAIEAVYATGIVEPSVMLPVAPRSGGRIAALLVDEGAAVKKGQVLARMESPDLAHTVEEMQARERLAQTQYERTRDLVAQNFMSTAELDRTRTELDAAQAALKRAQAQLDFNQLVAPADGSVLRRDGEIGQFIPAGQPVFTLECCAPLRVAAEVDEEDIVRVAIGQKVVLRGDALPDRVFDGKVAEITPKGDPVARSYRVRIAFADPAAVVAAGVRTGMTMDANIIIARREGVLLVPNRALHGDTVWIVEDGRLHARSVGRGVVGAERTEITSGLAEGDAVVVSGVEAAREGRRARVTPAAAAPAPASAAAR